MSAPFAVSGPWSPLRRPVFRALWIATLFSNAGTWMHDIGAGWLMVSLSADPLMVALVQAATAFPVFVLSLPAGALADTIDRRRYLIGTQCWTMFAATLLGVSTLAGWVNAWLLLGMTVLVGAGAAMMAPAWVATVPDLVPREELQPALTLNSLSINASRAVGPALAGVIVAAWGSGWTFLLNAAAAGVVFWTVCRWRHEPAPATLPPERLAAAMAAGLRYVAQAPALQAAMVRAFTFYVFSMALWALLPLIARDRAGGGPMTFGLLHAALGVGAMTSVLLLPWMRARMPLDRLVRYATVLYAAGMSIPALTRNPVLIAVGTALCGVAWISVLASLHVAAQSSVSSWVRARATALYMTSFATGSVCGSTLWGPWLRAYGVPFALVAAAAGALAAIFVTGRFALRGEVNAAVLVPQRPGVAPSGTALPSDGGPVRVSVAYRIDPAREAEFLVAMDPLRRIRLRDGATGWRMSQDPADPARHEESFHLASSLEYLRLLARETVADQAIHERLRAMHVLPDAPEVTVATTGSGEVDVWRGTMAPGNLRYEEIVMTFDAGRQCAGNRGPTGGPRLLRVVRACALAAFAAGAGTGCAQGYPEKPVRLVVPFPPGGNIDIAARTIAPGLSEVLGGSFVVDYRPGASGTIGVDHVAKSAPDGYTLLIGSTGTISSPPAVYAKLPFDTLRDLAPIAQVNDTPLVIVVHPSLRARTVRELVGLAKEQPGRMTMGTPGSGTPNYLAGVLLQQQAGIALTHVPYKGSGPGIIEVMGGHVDIFVDQLTSSMSYIRSARLRALAVTTGVRSSYLPDVPTLAEAGVKGYEASTFAGLLAPAGTPRSLVDRINAAVVKVVATGAVRERFATVGAEAKSGTPEQFRELIRADLAKWVRVVREAGIKLEL